MIETEKIAWKHTFIHTHTHTHTQTCICVYTYVYINLYDNPGSINIIRKDFFT